MRKEKLSKTEPNFFYSNKEDFDKVIVTTFRQSLGDLLLIKKNLLKIYLRETKFEISTILGSIINSLEKCLEPGILDFNKIYVSSFSNWLYSSEWKPREA